MTYLTQNPIAQTRRLSLNTLTIDSTLPEGDLATCYPLKRKAIAFPRLDVGGGSLVTREGKHVCSRVPGCFAVFATLKGELSRKERELIGKFALWGRIPGADGHPRCAIIVLTGNELFFDYHLLDLWRSLGEKYEKLTSPAYVHIDNLRTLAELTQSLYLDIEPYGKWLHRWYEEKHKRKKAKA